MKAIREATSLIPEPWEADTGRSHRWVQGQPDLHSQFPVSQVYRNPVSEIKNEQTKREKGRRHMKNTCLQ